MNMSGAYQGSMAFNQYLSLQEDVSLNTGSLTLTRPIVGLPGINESIELAIGLTYSIGVQGILGLPNNWTFNIPYVVPGATATVNGQTSIIDFNWSDETGYQSGLRYVNNHGILFQSINPPQPLPSGKGGAYAFRYTYSDGSRDYFDATGKLLEHDDVFGNYNYFTYSNQFAGVYGNSLASVTDSYGQTVKFSYAPGAVIVALPNGGSITINFSAQGVANLVDELGCVTTFSYGLQAGYDVVIQITYPTGLCSRITYTTIPYATSAGSAAFPAVSSLLRLDGGTTFMNQTNYTYGLKTNGNTYTGQSAGYLLGNSNDGLMDSNNISYRYDTTVSIVDGLGKLLAYTEYYYNYLHCLMVKNIFLLGQSGIPQNCFEINNTYEVDTDWHARTTNFNKPSTSVTTAWSATAGAFVPTQNSTFSYDPFGNPLTATVAMYNVTTQTYVPQSVSSFSYVVAVWGGEMPQTAVVADAITGFALTSTYTLTADQKNVAATVQTYQTTAAGPVLPWKTMSRTFDSQGRHLSEQLAWSAGAPNPNPQLASATTTYAYAFDLASNTLTTTKTDPLGNVAVNKTLTSYPNGIIVAAINPLGQTSTFAYDITGRLTTTTDPLGNVTTLSYACAQQGGVNQVSTVTQTGYTTNACCDGLGRQVTIMDNGGLSSGGVDRVVSQTLFNAQGLAASVSGLLGLATTYQYDALGRLVSSTDPHGNVTTVAYGDMQLTATTSLNGVEQTCQVSDNLGRPVMTARYAAQTDPSIDYSVNQTTALDGLGRPASVTLQQCPLSGGPATTLTVMSKTYDPENRVATESFTGYQSQQASAVKTIQRDLFGNSSSYTKDVTYADGRSYQWSSEIFAYDAGGNLVSRTNRLQQTESYTYNPVGRMATYIRYDGTVVTYSYDANGNMTALASGDTTFSYAYYPDNKLESVSQGGVVIAYRYYLDGGLQQTSYPDGTSQTITIDQYSRIAAVTDFGSTSTSIGYTPVGQIASKQTGSQQLTCSYGVVNGVNDILVAAVLTGAATVNYAYSYNGFGRLAGSSATLSGASNPLLAAAYSYDAQGRTLGLATTTGTASTSTSYTYDGVNQVTAQSSVQGSAPAATTTLQYDGNTNVVSISVNGVAQTLSYNAIDQLQQPGVTYDTNGRLVQDGAGNIFAYDAFDKLTGASGSGGTVGYAYYPDGMLATRSVSGASTAFYYSDGTATQVRNTASGQDNWLSYMFNGQARLASVDAAGDTSYLMAANNSTMAVCNGGSSESLQYQPYGSQPPSQQSSAPSFAWKQEYADPDNGVVYLRSRFYHPALMRFMSMDSYAVSNRYAFGDGNPIDNLDPTGHLSQGAAMGIGIGVGILATLVTGGALGVVVGTDLAASIAVGAVAGAVGSVAGDGTTAALSGQRFTAERALIDIGAGAAGGAIGAGVGGAVGRGAMSYALDKGLSRGAITAIGATSAGLSGGVAGAAGASGVTSAAYGQPFFSSATALNMVVGGVAGLGGGLLASGAQFGLGSRGGSDLRTLPIEATNLSTFNSVRFTNPAGRLVVDFSPSDGDSITDPALTNGDRDAVIIHGFMRHIFPETMTNAGLNLQYMTPEDFAALLRNNYGMGGRGGRDINLWSCFAAKLRLASVAQRMATALNVSVWAPACRDSVSLDYTGAWIQYRP